MVGRVGETRYLPTLKEENSLKMDRYYFENSSPVGFEPRT
jgi:hypothetical protein